MQSLLILGTGSDQLEGIIEAKKLGLHTIGLDGDSKAPGASLVDEFHNINIKNLDEVLVFLRNYPSSIDGVIAFGVDIPEVLAKVAEERGLHFQLSYEKAKLSKNKYLAKKLMEEYKVSLPPYRGVDKIEELRDFISDHGYPVVLKPVDNSASRGVLYVTEDVDLEWAFRESLKYVNDRSFSPPLIVEKFIKGQQLSTESIIYQGKLYTIGLSDRNYEFLDRYAPYIVENGGDLPPKLNGFKDYSEMINKIDEQLYRAIKAFGSKDGTIKGDIVIDEFGEVYIIEVAFRLSGGMLALLEVPLNTRVNFPEYAIKLAIGEEISVDDLYYRIENFVRMRMIFTEQIGIVKSLSTPDQAENCIIRWYVSPGDSIKEHIERYKLSATKLGWYILYSDSLEKIDEIENYLKDNIRVEII